MTMKPSDNNIFGEVTLFEKTLKPGGILPE
jgi:hypothetical protein